MIMLIINIIKVLLILALFIYVLQRKDKDYLLKIAFLFTLASDVILAIATANNIDSLLPVGTMVFCFAQLAYFCRHCPHKTFLKIYLPLILTALFIPNIFVYSAVYAITEVFNLIFTLKQDRRTALGFALFIACDLCIVIGFVGLVPESITSWLCWIFYLPAQILLAISKEPVLK